MTFAVALYSSTFIVCIFHRYYEKHQYSCCIHVDLAVALGVFVSCRTVVALINENELIAPNISHFLIEYVTHISLHIIFDIHIYIYIYHAINSCFMLHEWSHANHIPYPIASVNMLYPLFMHIKQNINKTYSPGKKKSNVHACGKCAIYMV